MHRAQAHYMARIAVAQELVDMGFVARHAAPLDDLKSGDYQTHRRRRMAGDLMPCDFAARVGNRLVFIKAAGASTNFTSSHRFLAYASEAGHDYLIVSTGMPIHRAMGHKFPRGFAALDDKPTVARITHVSNLEDELCALLARPAISLPTTESKP